MDHTALAISLTGALSWGATLIGLAVWIAPRMF